MVAGLPGSKTTGVTQLRRSDPVAPELLAQEVPASVDSGMATPATQRCRDAAGSTQIRPNHQPYVDCDEVSVDELAVRVHVVPASVDVQKPRKFPLVSAAIV